MWTAGFWPTLCGQLASALGAACKAWGHTAEMFLTLSRQDTSPVQFPELNASSKCVFQTLVCSFDNLNDLSPSMFFGFFFLFHSECSKPPSVINQFTNDLICLKQADFWIYPFLSTCAAPQELLVPAQRVTCCCSPCPRFCWAFWWMSISKASELLPVFEHLCFCFLRRQGFSV